MSNPDLENLLEHHQETRGTVLEQGCSAQKLGQGGPGSPGHLAACGYHWRLGDATGLGRPEGLRTASCDARESPTV